MEPKVIHVGKALIQAYKTESNHLFEFLSSLGARYCSYSQDIFLSLWDILTTSQQIPAELFLSQVQYWPDPEAPTSALFIKLDFRKKFEAMAKYCNALCKLKVAGIYAFTDIFTYVAQTDLNNLLLDAPQEDITQLSKETTKYILDFSMKKSTEVFPLRKTVIDYQLADGYNHDTGAMLIALKDLVRQFDQLMVDQPEFVDGEHKEVNTFVYITDVDDLNELYSIRIISFLPCDMDAIEVEFTLHSLDEIMRYFDLEQVLTAYAYQIPFLTNFDFS